MAVFGLLIAVFCATAAFSQARRERPSWVAVRPREAECFVGIGIALIEGDLPAAREQALRSALNDIALQVEARVSSDARLLSAEGAGETHQEYRSEVRTTAAEDLEGVEIAGTYEDGQHCWVYARLPAAQFQRRRQEKREQARQMARECFSLAEGAAPAAALALYLRGFAALQLAPGEPLRVMHRGEEISLAAEIPLRMQRLLSAIRLEAVPIGATPKQGAAVDLLLEIRARSAGGRPVQGLPVRFAFVRGGGELIPAALTGEEGVARSRLQRVRAPDPVQIIEARLELAALAAPDSRAAMEQRLRGFTLPAAILLLEVVPRTVYVASEEENLGQPFSCLGLLLREGLERRGQVLEETPGRAELRVELRARTREGTQWQGICFAFLDLSLALRDRVSGTEIFTASLSSVKGAGPDYEQAGLRAFEKAGQQLEEQLLDELLDHLSR